MYEFISKGQLYKIIDGVNKAHPYKVPGDYDTYSQYNEGWQDACNTIASIIDAKSGAEVGPMDYHERRLQMQAEKPNRVLALDEVAGICAVWVEETVEGKPSKVYPALYSGTACDSTSGHESCFVFIDRARDINDELRTEYNKTWRCWLRKPTAYEKAREEWKK